MFAVIGMRKKSCEEIVIENGLSRTAAEKICEQWGWSYDDGKYSYWMYVKEVNNDN